MKKNIITYAAAALGTLASCQSSKNITALTPADFSGEWNVVEVNGTAINLKEYPFIGFDTEKGRVYGNAGCNNVMGSFELNEKPGTLELGQMASTMMAGPNMDIERNVLNALGQVKTYKAINANELALCNEKKRPVVILKKRFQDMALTELNGEWNILKVYGEDIPANLEKQPFLAFDVAKKSVHGCASCNNISGSFTIEEKQKQSIAFPGMASTRMMCPDMELENRILQALNAVKSFGKLENGNLALFANGKLVMELAKK